MRGRSLEKPPASVVFFAEGPFAQADGGGVTLEEPSR